MSVVSVPAWSDFGDSTLPGLQMAAFSLCPNMAERVCKISHVSSYKVTNSIMTAPLS